jgi:soluble lytic murein transglycosylase
MKTALPRFGLRLLGALASRGPILPPLALALVLAGAPPAQGTAGAPVSLNPAPVASASEIAPSPEVAQVAQILDLKAPGLGLEVRGQLASALVEESRAAGLDPLMVLAVMRVESEFDEDALSVRGARGLMQLRPGTLAFLAHRSGLKLPADEILQDPVLSTRLAVRYIGRLVKSFHGDLDQALMAYNAGPHRLHVAVKARDFERLDRLSSYPRRVHRAYRHLRSLPPADDLALADGAGLPGTPPDEE